MALELQGEAAALAELRFSPLSLQPGNSTSFTLIRRFQPEGRLTGYLTGTAVAEHFQGIAEISGGIVLKARAGDDDVERTLAFTALVEGPLQWNKVYAFGAGIFVVVLILAALALNVWKRKRPKRPVH